MLKKSQKNKKNSKRKEIFSVKLQYCVGMSTVCYASPSLQMAKHSPLAATIAQCVFGVWKSVSRSVFSMDTHFGSHSLFFHTMDDYLQRLAKRVS